MYSTESATNSVLNSIEKYSIELGYWQSLTVSTPLRVKNNFAFCINSHEIVLLGGKHRQSSTDDRSSSQTVNKVYVFNTVNCSFKSLPKLPFTHKVSGVFYNDNGKAL